MDFSFSEEQEAVRDLAAQILGERVTHERLKEFEAGTELVDRATWAELAKANLLGIALPPDVGERTVDHPDHLGQLDAVETIDGRLAEQLGHGIVVLRGCR